MTLNVTLNAHIPSLGRDVKISGTIEEAASDSDPLAAMQAWLANIDPGELERAALEGLGMGSESVAAEMLNVLRRWAGGNP